VALALPLLLEAINAEEAIAIENELPNVSETVLAFVTMLCFLIHGKKLVYTFKSVT
jgi:hypothetical protein